ncbi:MAG: glycosyltransferase family protein [Nitrososphaerales archaeon]
MAHRIHIAVFGVGLGHAARMSLVADMLRNHGEAVNFSSFYYAVEYLRKKGFNCDRVAPMDIGWREGGVSAKGTFRHIPTFFSNFAQQVRQEGRIIDRFQPDLVISDSRLSAVVAAYLAGIPSVTVSNQLRILLPPKYHPTSLSKVERIDAELLGLFWSRSRLILVPDLPPPYTISERNTREGVTVKGRVRYVGFMTPVPKVGAERIHKVSNMLEMDGGKHVVFTQISGPPETTDRMMEAALEAAEALSDRFTFVISKGEVGGDEEPRRIRGGWVFEWCPVKDELFFIADLLVVRGGHSSLSQAIRYGKPLVAVPIRNHSEQVMNTRKVVDMGLGLSVDSSMVTGRSLASAVENVSGDASFREKAREVGEVARKLNGVKNTVDIVKSLL